MLRANVGLSRKLSKDYNSTGFSINLDGEILAAVTDTEAVVERVRELFDLAEEALDRQVEGHQSESAIGSRDAEPAPATRVRVQRPAAASIPARTNGNGHQESAAHTNGGNGETQPEQATNKQINYLLNLGKRNRLSTAQLEQQIQETLGYAVSLYDLSKRDAAQVIDALAGTATNGRFPARS